MVDADSAPGGHDHVARARAAARLAHRGGWPRGTAVALSESVAHDPEPSVRRAALSALLRRGRPARALAAWHIAAEDTDASVRRAAAHSAAALVLRLPAGGAARTQLALAVTRLLDDREPLVAESAAFALGEIVPDERDTGAQHAALDALIRHAVDHADALVRESCVAALGALRAGDVDGSERALPAILAASRDKPAIRRRAVIALAAFDAPEAEHALHEALTDRDWQVRQLAEDLTSES